MHFLKKIISSWKQYVKNSNEKKIESNERMKSEIKKNQKEEEDTNFFKENVLNWQSVTNIGGSLLIDGTNVAAITINDKKKSVTVEIIQTGIKGVTQGGASYQVPYYIRGYLLCNDAEYKIVDTDIDGGVFILFNDKNSKTRLKLMLNHNRKGIEIVCDKIEAVDFKNVKVEHEEFKDLDIGRQWGKYFSIKHENANLSE